MTPLLRQTITLGPDISHPEPLTLQVDVIRKAPGEPDDDSGDPTSAHYPIEIQDSPWGPLRARVRVVHVSGDV